MNETLIHADIFFFIASIGTIIFIILISIAIYYLIGLLKNVRNLTGTLQDKVNGVSEDLEEMRKKISESLIYNLIFMKKKDNESKKTKSRTKKKDE